MAINSNMDNIFALVEINLNIHTPPVEGRIRRINENLRLTLLEEFKVEREQARAFEFVVIPVI